MGTSLDYLLSSVMFGTLWNRFDVRLISVCLSTHLTQVAGPIAAYNEWRSQTFRFLQRCEHDVVGRKYATETHRQKNHLIDDIAITMMALTGCQINPTQLLALHSVVDHAVVLSRLLSIQHAEYKCVLPRAEGSEVLTFDGSMMEDIFVGATEGRVQYVVFPAVLKVGDERGENVSISSIRFQWEADGD